MWHGYGWFPGFHMGGWGTLLVILVVFLIFRSRRGCGWGYRPEFGQERSTALEILNERYARGEVTKAEFDQIKADLQG